MEELEKTKARIIEIGGRVRRLLASDVHAYVTTSVRERFVAESSFADGLGEAQLATLKRATSHAADVASGLVRDLLDDAVWPTVTLTDGDDVRQASPVDAALTRVEAHLATFFAEHALPGDAPGYTLPVRFIDGDDLISLTRALTRSLARLGQLRAIQVNRVEESSTHQRRQRWDDA